MIGQDSQRMVMRAEKQEFINMVSESLLSKVQENEGGIQPDTESYGYDEK